MALIQNDPWAEFPVVGGAPGGPPSAPGPVTIGTPRPRQPALPGGFEPNPERPGALRPQTGGPSDPEQIRAEAEARREPESGDVANMTPEQQAELRAEALQKIRLGRSLIERSGGWTTSGLGGSVASRIPGTAGYDMAADIETMRAAGALQRIMELTQRTGKNPLTPISNADFQALGNSLSNLDIGQGSEQFRRNVNTAIDMYRRAYEAAGGQDLETDLGASPGGGDPGQPGFVADVLAPAAQAAPDVPQPAPDAPPDRLTAAEAPAMAPGQGRPEASTTTRTVTDRQLAAIAPRVGLMISRGATGAQISEFMRRNGVDPAATNINAILSQRANPQSDTARWIRQHPREPYPINPTYEETLSEPEQTRAEISSSPAASFILGSGDVATMGGLDEAVAGLRTLANGQSYSDNLGSTRFAQQVSQEANPGSYFGGQMLGGLTLPFSPTRNLLGLSGQGAGFGAAYGFGSGEGDIGDRLTNAGVNAALGATAAPLIELGVRAPGATRRFLRGEEAPASPPPEDIARAMADEGVRGARPIADPTRRDQMAYLETTRGGNRTVRQGLEQTRGDIERRAGELGAAGTAQTERAMGETIQGAGERRLGAMRRLGRRYFRQAETAAGSAEIRGSELVAEIDGQIANLSADPARNAAKIDFLRELRSDYANDTGLFGKPVRSFRELRTDLRDEINRRSLAADRGDVMTNGLVAAATRDIERDLGAAAPDALNLYRQGDAVWRRMHTDREQIVERLIGPANNRISGERATARLTDMMRNRGDFERFRRTVEMMTPAERRDFAATIIEPIGQRSAEESWTPAVFLNNTRNLSAESLRELFGPEAARSISNLRLASRGFVDAQGRLNNSRSGFVLARHLTAPVLNFRSTLGGMIGFYLGGPAGAVAGGALGAGARYLGDRLSARTLMNSDVSRWIGKVSHATTPTAVRTGLAELRTIAARNPALAPELTGLHGRLSQAANDNFSPAAAASEPREEQERQQ